MGRMIRRRRNVLKSRCFFPFGVEVEKFLADHEYCFVVEQNRDAQLRTLLLLETGVL